MPASGIAPTSIETRRFGLLLRVVPVDPAVLTIVVPSTRFGSIDRLESQRDNLTRLQWPVLGEVVGRNDLASHADTVGRPFSVAD